MSNKKRPWVSIHMVIVAFLIIVCGIFLFNLKSRVSARCTEATTATVISCRDKFVRSHEIEYSGYTVFVPTVRYSVDGIWYQGEPIDGAFDSRPSVGDSVTVYYNPQTPQEFCVRDNSDAFILYGAIAVIGAYTFFTLTRKDKKEKYSRGYS